MSLQDPRYIVQSDTETMLETKYQSFHETNQLFAFNLWKGNVFLQPFLTAHVFLRSQFQSFSARSSVPRLKHEEGDISGQAIFRWIA